MQKEPTDTKRYSRLAALPEIGPEGVARLRGATIGVIGCGALGSLCCMYLAASGIGHIKIADFDTVDISNLQRQLFFTEEETGKSKAQLVALRIKALNSEVEVSICEQLIRAENAMHYFSDCDVIIDGSDNPDTKLMTDRVSTELGIPCVIAGVHGFECQVMTCGPDTRRYSDIFGQAPGCNGFTPCSVAGVLGPAAGVAASIQASEAIKLVTHAGTPLTDRLFILDLLTMHQQIISI